MGRDFQPQMRFDQLLRALLERTGIEKVRISSVEPMDWSDELIALVDRIRRGSPGTRTCPLQSGSDAILRGMHRKYRPWHYAEKIRKSMKAMPGAAIGADVMVGFPGETDALFEESRSFIERLAFHLPACFYLFVASETASAAMPGQVPDTYARERNRCCASLPQRRIWNSARRLSQNARCDYVANRRRRFNRSG